MTLDARSAMVEGYGYGANSIVRMGFIPIAEPTPTGTDACAHAFASLRSTVALVLSLCAFVNSVPSETASISITASKLSARSSNEITVSLLCSDDANEARASVTQTCELLVSHGLGALCSTALSADVVTCSKSIAASVSASVDASNKVTVSVSEC